MQHSTVAKTYILIPGAASVQK